MSFIYIGFSIFFRSCGQDEVVAMINQLSLSIIGFIAGFVVFVVGIRLGISTMAKWQPFTFFVCRRLFGISLLTVPVGLFVLLLWQRCIDQDLDFITAIAEPIWLFCVLLTSYWLMGRELRKVKNLDLRGKPTRDEGRRRGVLNYIDMSYFSMGDLGDVPNLEWLSLSGCSISGSGLRYLHAVPKLRFLDLSESGIEDVNLEHLPGAPGLEVLRLRNTSVGDQGLRYIGKLDRLEELDLSGTHITDAGVELLHELRRLKVISVDRTALTVKGLTTDFTDEHG